MVRALTSPPSFPLRESLTSPHFFRLSANYAPYPDGNVPRQGLYNSYRRVCDLYNIPHINTATLGKAIRLCFPAIKTRRLGVRGNSKYHCESTASLYRKKKEPFVQYVLHLLLCDALSLTCHIITLGPLPPAPSHARALLTS